MEVYDTANRLAEEIKNSKQYKDLKEAKDNFKSLEKQLKAFVKLLPEEYRQGFSSDINKLNGRDGQKYLDKFYLEITDVGIHIKESN